MNNNWVIYQTHPPPGEVKISTTPLPPYFPKNTKMKMIPAESTETSMR